MFALRLDGHAARPRDAHHRMAQTDQKIGKLEIAIRAAPDRGFVAFDVLRPLDGVAAMSALGDTEDREAHVCRLSRKRR